MTAMVSMLSVNGFQYSKRKGYFWSAEHGCPPYADLFGVDQSFNRYDALPLISAPFWPWFEFDLVIALLGTNIKSYC